jgi:uncharacterized membrane protein
MVLKGSGFSRPADGDWRAQVFAIGNGHPGSHRGRQTLARSFVVLTTRAANRGICGMPEGSALHADSRLLVACAPRNDKPILADAQSRRPKPEGPHLAKWFMKRQNSKTMSHKRNHSPHDTRPGNHRAGVEQARHELPSEHRRGLLPEKYFRWRSGEITRLEAFCDVVFGFALTLLVVSLEVPRNYAELMAAMRGFVPFAVCFAQLVMIWRAHYIFCRRYGLEDGYTVFLNVVLLFVVLFYVYPLKFVFTMLFLEVTGAAPPDALNAVQASVVMRIYAVGFASVFVLFMLMYGHAYRLRNKLELSPVETLETRNALQENILLVMIGAISFFIAFRSPAWSGWTYALIGPVMTVHGSIFGRRVRVLAEKG